MTPAQAGTWTAVGTLTLAVMTLAAVITTIVITVQDRKRAAADLADERQLADGRLREERDHAEDVRRRERQADSARVLIQRIAVLQPYLDTAPGTFTRYTIPGAVTRHHGDEQCREAISSLQHGALADAPFLGDGKEAQEAAARYRVLVQLVLSAANDGNPGEEQKAATLRAYARWVKISLRMLAADGRVPPMDGGSPPRHRCGSPVCVQGGEHDFGWEDSEPEALDAMRSAVIELGGARIAAPGAFGNFATVARDALRRLNAVGWPDLARLREAMVTADPDKGGSDEGASRHARHMSAPSSAASPRQGQAPTRAIRRAEFLPSRP